ncbi:hypothetical protein KR044_004506, partial [Drosophila immigrans]
MYSNYKILNVKLRAPNDKSMFPNVTPPQNVGVYSVSPEGQFENFSTRMRFFDPSVTCPFTLRPTGNLPQDEDVEFSESRSYLDTLLLFLMSTKERQQLIQESDIVCSRDLLVRLMCSPHHSDKKWSIAASRYRNTIYLCHVPDTEEVKLLDEEHLKKLITKTWLKKLRQHCLVSRVESMYPIDTYEQRLEDGQLYGVFKMTCEGLRILLDAPVIADKSNNQFIGQPRQFVDLQLRLDTMTSAEWRAHYRNEVLLWWAQCFLSGIKTIHVALHDQDAVVHRINKLEIRNLWEELMDNSSVHVCSYFMLRFLKEVKQVMATVDSASTVYLIEYEPETENFIYKVAVERNDHTFLPDWYR